ncbi:hypothetical protein HDU67_004464 [Dinochytrium kinnereticum]|nr:hypothetical protein HDU67_004464 [Dinochytrium kinnereticum]
MNFLNAYGSDSDDDSVPAAAPAATTSHKETKLNLPAPIQQQQKQEQPDLLGKRKRVQILVDLPLQRAKEEDGPAPVKKDVGVKKGLFAVLPPPKAATAKTDGGATGVAFKPFLPNSVRNRVADEGRGKGKGKDDLGAFKEAEDAGDSFFSFDVAESKPSFTNEDSSYRRPIVASLEDVEVPLPLNAPSTSANYDELCPHDPTLDANQIAEMNDVTLSRRNKRGRGEEAIQFIEVSQTEQLGDTWKMEAQRNLTRDRPKTGAIDSIKPSYASRKTHNIMALAYDAKMRETEIADSFALRKAQKNESRANRLVSSLPVSPLLQQPRLLSYAKKANEDLPGYILPRQRTKTSWLKKSMKMKFFRMRFGKSGQRPKQPRYGRDDAVLSKMNI